MPRLFVLAGRDVGRSFEARSGAVLGRAPDCDIRLNEPSVSRRHARLEHAEGRWWIIDLGSRNGLRSGGERVERAVLLDHDEVVLGDLPLRFRADEAPGQAGFAGESSSVSSEAAGGIVLEEEIDLAPTVVRPRPVRGLAEPEPQASAEEPASALSSRDRARAELLRPRSRGTGFLGGDLAQRPTWMQALLFLLVLLAAGGIGWGAFRLVAYLRSTV